MYKQNSKKWRLIQKRKADRAIEEYEEEIEESYEEFFKEWEEAQRNKNLHEGDLW